MSPSLSVIQQSTSFTQVWPGLAESSGCELRIGTVTDALAGVEPTMVLISAGGVEAEALATLGRFRVGGDRPRTPVAVVGSVADHRLAIQLLQAGAQDYFALPAEFPRLRAWIVEHVQRARADIERRAIGERQRAQYDYSQLIGKSDGLRRVLELTTRVTPHREATVLLTGETGTGKELIARAIHFNESRTDRPFVEINCSALPGNLLEAELLGYEPGAFTDARVAKPGLFELADGGTIFLDEIGDMPVELQAKLLRILEEKRVRRLGGTVSRDVNARVIAATHVDLPAAVRANRFREDLYYRLNVFRIHLPPLRERREDIDLLADHFIARFAVRYGLETPTLSARLRNALCAHSWPGNVRELRNAMERSLLTDEEHVLLADAGLRANTAEPSLPFPANLATIQHAAAVAMLARHNGNKSAAAESLGISRKRLYALLEGHTGEADAPASPVSPLNDTETG